MTDKEIIDKYFELRSCRAVAEQYEISGETVRRILKKNNVSLTGWKCPKKEPKYHCPPKLPYTDKEIIEAYWKYGTHAKAGEALGISRTSVKRALDNNGISVRRKKICECCGKEFECCFGKTRYCSKQCYDHVRRSSHKIEPYHKICKVCGAGYNTSRSQSVTCSPECAKAYKRPKGIKYVPIAKWVCETQSDFEYVSHTRGRIKLKCKICGNVIERAKSTVKYKNVRCEYCEEEKQLQEARQKMVRFFIALKDAKTPKQCKYCGKLFTSTYPTQMYCSTQCKHKIKRRRSGHRKRCQKYGVDYDNSVTLPKIIARDKNICQLCGRPCDKNSLEWGTLGPLYPTIDHITALANGGTHTWDNVQLAHAICNSYKRDLDDLETITEEVSHAKIQTA